MLPGGSGWNWLEFMLVTIKVTWQSHATIPEPWALVAQILRLGRCLLPRINRTPIADHLPSTNIINPQHHEITMTEQKPQEQTDRGLLDAFTGKDGDNTGLKVLGGVAGAVSARDGCYVGRAHDWWTGCRSRSEDLVTLLMRNGASTKRRNQPRSLRPNSNRWSNLGMSCSFASTFVSFSFNWLAFVVTSKTLSIWRSLPTSQMPLTSVKRRRRTRRRTKKYVPLPLF